MNLGERIAALRKEQGMTQERLAELVGVTSQAVSKWENNWTQPDHDKLASIAGCLNTTVPALLREDGALPAWVLRDRMFSEESMFTRMRTFAQMEGLRETNKALYYARTMHKDQYRKKGVLGKTEVPYIIHPLMVALHAHAMGLRDDVLLASTLLHDVCEDCHVLPRELPFSEEVREIVGRMPAESPVRRGFLDLFIDVPSMEELRRRLERAAMEDSAAFDKETVIHSWEKVFFP